MFGVDDLFAILAGGGYALAKGAQSGSDKTRLGMYHDLKDEYLALNTDPALETHLKKQIEDPACYNAVWERIEAYRRVRGWEPVERLPFFDKKGNLHPRNQYDETTLHGNRNRALGMLMQTYGKLTVFEAENKIIDFGNSMYGIALLKDIVDRQKSGQRAETLEELDPYYERAEVAEADRVSGDIVAEVGREDLSLFCETQDLRQQASELDTRPDMHKLYSAQDKCEKAYRGLIYNFAKATKGDIYNIILLQKETKRFIELFRSQIEEAKKQPPDKFLRMARMSKAGGSISVVVGENHPPISKILYGKQALTIDEYVSMMHEKFIEYHSKVFETMTNLWDIGENDKARELFYEYRSLIKTFITFCQFASKPTDDYHWELQQKRLKGIETGCRMLDTGLQEAEYNRKITEGLVGEYFVPTEEYTDILNDLCKTRDYINQKYASVYAKLMVDNKIELADELQKKVDERNRRVLAMIDAEQRFKISEDNHSFLIKEEVRYIQKLESKIRDILDGKSTSFDAQGLSDDNDWPVIVKEEPPIVLVPIEKKSKQHLCGIVLIILGIILVSTTFIMIFDMLDFPDFAFLFVAFGGLMACPILWLGFKML